MGIVKHKRELLVQVSPALARTLAAARARTGRSQADLVREALRQGLIALRLGSTKTSLHRRSLEQHFKGLRGLELPPYLEP